MTNFETAMTFTAKWEGIKFTTVKDDKGGPTKYGITLGAAKAAKLDKDADGDVDKEDVQLLTPVDALMVYKKDYWDFYNCEKYGMPMAVAVFDAYVQHRPDVVRKQMIEPANGDWRVFLTCRKDFYVRLVMKDPTQKKFAAGWSNRMNDLSKFCQIYEQDQV